MKFTLHLPTSFKLSLSKLNLNQVTVPLVITPKCNLWNSRKVCSKYASWPCTWIPISSFMSTNIGIHNLLQFTYCTNYIAKELNDNKYVAGVFLLSKICSWSIPGLKKSSWSIPGKLKYVAGVFLDAKRLLMLRQLTHLKILRYTTPTSVS